MTKSEKLLKQLTPELLELFSNYPNFGSIGLNITLHESKPVKIDTSKTVTMKVSKGGK